MGLSTAGWSPYEQDYLRYLENSEAAKNLPISFPRPYKFFQSLRWPTFPVIKNVLHKVWPSRSGHSGAEAGSLADETVDTEAATQSATDNGTAEEQTSEPVKEATVEPASDAEARSLFRLPVSTRTPGTPHHDGIVHTPLTYLRIPTVQTLPQWIRFVNPYYYI